MPQTFTTLVILKTSNLKNCDKNYESIKIIRTSRPINLPRSCFVANEPWDNAYDNNNDSKWKLKKTIDPFNFPRGKSRVVIFDSGRDEN